jgi:hypothetical protein
MTVMNFILFLIFFFKPKKPNRLSWTSSSLDSPPTSSLDEWITDPDRTEILRSRAPFCITSSLLLRPWATIASGTEVVSMLTRFRPRQFYNEMEI